MTPGILRRHPFAGGFLPATLMLLLASGAGAQIKNFRFSGTISTVDDRGFVLDGSIAEGTPFEGFYVFDASAAADSNEDPTVGDFRFTGSRFGIVVKAGGYVFRTNPQHVDFLMEMVNRPDRDNYLLLSYNNVCSKPLAVEHIAWQLDDPAAAALTDALLPAVPPVMESWQSTVGLTITGDGMRGFFLRGHITAISETPAVIPERPEAVLNDAVEVKWQSRLGYFYQIQKSEDMQTWTDVGEPVLGDGTELSRFFARAPGKSLFYRAEIANYHRQPEAAQ